MNPYSLFIGGRSVATTDHVEITNPSTGEPVGLAPIGTLDDLDAAVSAAAVAFKSWSMAPDRERAEACAAIAEAIEAHAEELARLLTLEQGKPLNGMGSRYEIGGAVAWSRYASTLSLDVETLQDDDQAHIELHRKAIGVVGSITPWNWPVMIAIWHVIPAIRTGNTVVIKPSLSTPLSTIRLVEVMNTVLPAGALNVVTGRDELGAAMSTHERISKIVVTGSTETGRKVMRSAAATLKRITLELGGNDAGIVLPDADPEKIAEGLFWGAFINNGQTCAALKRLYVHDSIYDATCDALLRVANGIAVGDGLDEANVLGPIQNRAQFDKVKRLVDEAKASGARVLCGGEAHDGPGHFYPVTLIADAKDGMSIVDEEQFGPALPIIRYHDVEQALSWANASENGLGGFPDDLTPPNGAFGCTTPCLLTQAVPHSRRCASARAASVSDDQTDWVWSSASSVFTNTRPCK